VVFKTPRVLTMFWPQGVASIRTSYLQCDSGADALIELQRGMQRPSGSASWRRSIT
jgi:hypothetical protein